MLRGAYTERKCGQLHAFHGQYTNCCVHHIEMNRPWAQMGTYISMSRRPDLDIWTFTTEVIQQPHLGTNMDSLTNCQYNKCHQYYNCRIWSHTGLGGGIVMFNCSYPRSWCATFNIQPELIKRIFTPVPCEINDINHTILIERIAQWSNNFQSTMGQ